MPRDHRDRGHNLGPEMRPFFEDAETALPQTRADFGRGKYEGGRRPGFFHRGCCFMGCTRFRACLVLSRSGRGYPGLLELISRRCSAPSLSSTAESESRHLWRVGPFLRASPAQDFPSDMGTRGPSVDLPSAESRRLLAAAGMALGWLFWIVSLEAPLFCQAARGLLQAVSGLGLPCAARAGWTGLVRGGCAV